MELFSNSFQSCREACSEDFIQSEQDGLFFGLSYLKESLNSESFSKITSYFSEGDCIFKGQTLLSIEWESAQSKKKDLLSVVSYLSGAFTLVSCWTEKNFDFSICVDLTPRFELSQWEEKAVSKAGAVARSFPTEFLSLKKIQQELKKGKSAMVLSDLKISRDHIKSFLKASHSSVLFDLHGSFLPSDLEEFREFNNIDSVYSTYLQGPFPCLPMRFAK